jgi:hypothetical protein
LVLVLCWLLGCTRESASAASAGATASFGVFYGGQVQQRKEIPFELDRTKQRQGFRIQFDPPLQETAKIEWEISRPARRSSPAATPSSPDGRITELGSTMLAQGQARFEEPLWFKPGDPLGLWNVRVVLGPRVLIDRAFLVYDASKRRHENSAARAPDAGL